MVRNEKRALSASPGHSPLNKQSRQDGLDLDSSMEKSRKSSSSVEELVQIYDSNVSSPRK